MKEQSENRRVRMTKRMMKDALLNLLERTELSGISVTALCEAADVNRSTFYSYYTSPSDLLGEIEQEGLDRIPTLAVPQDRQSEESLLRTIGAFLTTSEKTSGFSVSSSASRRTSASLPGWWNCSAHR